MKPKTNGNGSVQRAETINHYRGEGPNWVLVVGGALLSTLSIKLGCQLKRAFDRKRNDKANKECRKPTASRRARTCELHPDHYHFPQDEGSQHLFLSEIPRGVPDKRSRSPMATDADHSLPLVKLPAVETDKISGEGAIRASSPDRLELPWKPFHQSNCSDSCISESGSDIYSRREVIQKLRQQLKRRDETIMEMQAQISDILNSLHFQMAQTSSLQDQVDSANKELFDSQREVQRLRKVIADHRIVDMVSSPGERVPGRNRHSETTNGLSNGYSDSITDDLGSSHRAGGDKGKVEMLRREVSELKEVIEGKDFLLQNYREQKAELCSKIKEMQLKLASQVPDIL